MRVVVGVDSSTQSCKVLACDLESGTALGLVRRPHPTGTEVDPESWWSALQEALDELRAGLSGEPVAAVSVAAQQHGMILLDRDGRVIRPALLWNDLRSAAAAKQLTDELSPEEWARRTGSVPLASFTATKLRWVADHEPGAADRVAAVCLPHDWLTWRLRGFGPENPVLEELVTDRSDASGTSYFDLLANSWDRDLLSLALRRDSASIVLPEVLGPSETRPLGSDAVMGAGVGDNAAAALGLDLQPGDVVVSLGTSGTVFASTPQFVAGLGATAACFADARGGFLPLTSTLNAARILPTVADLLAIDLDELTRLAQQAPIGSGGLVLHGYFEGERTPDLPEESATLSGMNGVNLTRGNLARAAFESMVCGVAEGLTALGSTVPVRRILLIGGAAQSPATVEVAATVFDVPVEVPAPAEYVALGAARQAAWALTGEVPAWPVVSDHASSKSHDPQVLAQYRDYFRQRYGAGENRRRL